MNDDGHLCADCGVRIDAERLAAYPDAVRCRACAREGRA